MERTWTSLKILTPASEKYGSSARGSTSGSRSGSGSGPARAPQGDESGPGSGSVPVPPPKAPPPPSPPPPNGQTPRQVMSVNNSTSSTDTSNSELWTEGPWNASSSALVTALASSGVSLGLLGVGDDAWNATATATAPAVNTSRINETAPAFCDVWEANQHHLYQTANLFVCIAFLVPRHFKQSVLIYRFLLAIGMTMGSIWASFHLCAYDAFLWNSLLAVINIIHTAMLVVRFLPPALSPDLTELYLKVFRPLRVSKKAFKELAREGNVLALESGETYAIEEHTPADERLSILLRGKLAVSCDGTHLHHINIHQFVDSPEWEANHETSDNTFQVTITAEEDSVYLCWPRMKLARVLRHRPQVRIVLETLIGKDITHKLYSLNEHMMGVAGAESASKAAASDHLRGNLHRSLSVDAVHTGTRGNLRSTAFKNARKERAERTASVYSDSKDYLQSPIRAGQPQCWIPLVANHFPVVSPFTNAQGQPMPLTAAAAVAPALPAGAVPAAAASSGLALGGSLPPSSMALVPVPVIVPVLAPPPTLHQARNRSMRRGGVKFETPV